MLNPCMGNHIFRNRASRVPGDTGIPRTTPVMISALLSAASFPMNTQVRIAAIAKKDSATRKVRSDMPFVSNPPHINPEHSLRRLKPCPVGGRY
jgi:hypothetical protein